MKSKMIEAMLPVLDNFDLTAKNVKGENEGEENNQRIPSASQAIA